MGDRWTPQTGEAWMGDTNKRLDFVERRGNGIPERLGYNAMQWPVGMDWDDIVATGFHMGEQMLHAPGNTTSWMFVEVISYNFDHVVQIGHPFARGNASPEYKKIYKRTRNGNAWESWVLIPDETTIKTYPVSDTQLPTRLRIENNLGLAPNPNSYKDTGWYSGYQWSGLPDGGIGTLQVERYSPDWVSQIMTFVSAAPTVYTRAFYSGTTWSPWQRIYGTGSEIQAMSLPPGLMLPMAAVNVPAGYLLCDGGWYVRTDYPGLFNAIGTAFNPGGIPATHFAVPNLRGTTIFGIDTAQTEFNARGKTGGAKTHNHKHVAPVGLNSSAPWAISPSAAAMDLAGHGSYSYHDIVTGTRISLATSPQDNTVERHVVTSSDSSSLPPFVSLNYIIKT